MRLQTFARTWFYCSSFAAGALSAWGWTSSDGGLQGALRAVALAMLAFIVYAQAYKIVRPRVWLEVPLPHDGPVPR